MLERRLHWSAVHGVELTEAEAGVLVELAAVLLHGLAVSLLVVGVLHGFAASLLVVMLHDAAIMSHCTARIRSIEGPISCAFRTALDEALRRPGQAC